ncbi:hypothetical protein E2C01_039990 [Portunus trituberculatus]|uniref:Uncharacterized protein n=1 Tax=Portunus trituberculatus TaxID=210409 RepID=A0A5B7FLS9_PORTR|nr:hypothetical protein [Portunus trituberculatus]
MAPVGTLEEYVESTVQLPSISGTSNFIYSGTHIRAHITIPAHLGCKAITPPPRTWASWRHVGNFKPLNK